MAVQFPAISISSLTFQRPSVHEECRQLEAAKNTLEDAEEAVGE